VGEIIGSLDGVRYSYEPFNLHWSPRLKGHLSYFRYLDRRSDVDPVVQQVADDAFCGLQTKKQLLRAAYRGYLRSATSSGRTVVAKDPTAPLIADWVADRFNAKIVVLVRHPCGFASSIEKLEWQVRLDFLLRQEILMAEYLWPYEDILRRAKNDEWESLGAFWAAVYFVLRKQGYGNENWHTFMYEDLCNDPVGGFAVLIDELGLEMGSTTIATLESKSAHGNADPGSTSRLSEKMPAIWQHRMSKGAIDAVMGVVKEFEGFEYAYQSVVR
jgi:hypothetical protein